ncbi:MAG: RnfD [Microgenomates group bacterium GW2011_GWC1_49_7]|nr:MAG: RnfD [Microgenomates group bacterium GW2011_GWC1_49_7]
MNRLRIWWADSRGKVIVTLLAVWVSALLYHFALVRVLMPIIAITASVLFDLAVSYMRKGQWVFTLSTLVTGLLIGLIIDPTSGAAPVLLAAIIAAVSKQIIGSGDHRHVFNPAAIGIFGASYAFDLPVAWWAASWGVIPAAIIAVGMVRALYRLHRLWMSGIFLLVYVLITRSLLLTFDGTVFLFAFVMLPEPVTSVSGKMWRYAWGVMAGSFVAMQNFFPVLTIDPLLLSLLSANLIGFFFIRRPWDQTLLKR